jgi:hypothetical protein
MLFSLEVMQAYEGDCLILHVGKAAAPRFVVIDGGPSPVYREILAPRLDALRAAKYRNESLPIEYVIVTHVDDDHIQGVLDLVQDLRDKADNAAEQPYEIMGLWHNSFEGSLGDARGALFAAVGAAAGPAVAPAGVSPEAIRNAGLPAMAASIAQGRRLYEMARRLDIALNDEFPSLVMYDPDDTGVDLGAGARLRVLCPDEDSIEALRKEWKKAIQKAAATGRNDAVATAYADRSITNRSSIAFLAECQGKRMLLTGDARGDQIITGLKEVGYLKKKTCKVDILKLPHHGSKSNVDRKFFDTVRADHYVISADGKHGNPDLETLQMLSAARPDDRFTLHLTNRDGAEGLRETLQKFFSKESDKGRRYKVKYRPDTAGSMMIDLLDKVTY